MARVLNLDEYLADPSKVTFRGQEYPVSSISVETFFRILKLQSELDTATDYEEIIGKVVELLSTAVPEMPKEVLEKLTIPQLFGLLQFIVEELQKDPNVRRAMVKAKK